MLSMLNNLKSSAIQTPGNSPRVTDNEVNPVFSDALITYRLTYKFSVFLFLAFFLTLSFFRSYYYFISSDVKYGGQIWNDSDGMSEYDKSSVSDRTYGTLESQLADGHFLLEGKRILQHLFI